MDETDKFQYEMEQRHNKDIKEYKNAININLMKIKNGKTDIDVYASLFNDYNSLYVITEDDKGGPRVRKEDIDEVANKLFLLAKEVLQQECSSYEKAQAYSYLASICHYRKDKQKALECYNKAVEADNSFLSERGSFKNSVLNDRQGALEDYNKALAYAKNQDEIDLINFYIKNIDLLRDADKLLSESKWLNFKFYLIFAVIILYIGYMFYDAIKPFFH